MTLYAIVEKGNKKAHHGLFSNLEGAQRHLMENIPVYIEKSYFMDKTLTSDSFEIIEWRRK